MFFSLFGGDQLLPRLPRGHVDIWNYGIIGNYCIAICHGMATYMLHGLAFSFALAFDTGVGICIGIGIGIGIGTSAITNHTTHNKHLFSPFRCGQVNTKIRKITIKPV